MQDKHKVLHTRVSEDLYNKISSKAKKHRVTISNLMRGLVEDYIELSSDIFDIVDDKIKDHLKKEKEAILGYQAMTLSKDTVCDSCEKELKKGSKANLVLFEKTSRKAVLCDECKLKAEESTKK